MSLAPPCLGISLPEASWANPPPTPTSDLHLHSQRWGRRALRSAGPTPPAPVLTLSDPGASSSFILAFLCGSHSRNSLLWLYCCMAPLRPDFVFSYFFSCHCTLMFELMYPSTPTQRKRALQTPDSEPIADVHWTLVREHLGGSSASRVLTEYEQTLR